MRRSFPLSILASCLVAAVLCITSAAEPPDRVHITLLATTDMHGNLFPWDYYEAAPANRGLVKLATLIGRVRAENANSLLVDCGDTIQGTPLEGVYQEFVRMGRIPYGLALAPPPAGDPMMRAMNAIGYDTMVVGNHEWNFGLKNLEAARSQAKFPWISANIVAAPGSSAQPFRPYILKEFAGVKVAVVGLTTPNIPTWEPPDHYTGYEFRDGVATAREIVTKLRETEHPDVIVIAVHSGLDRDMKTGAMDEDSGTENMVYRLATQVNGVDAIVFGHTHNAVPDLRIGQVLLMQPKNWAASLGRMDINLERANGAWRIVNKSGRLLPASADVPEDPEIAAVGRPYHELAEKVLSSKVAEAGADLDATLSRVEDTPIIDAIQEVELDAAHADVSLTDSFNTRVHIPKGPVTIRQLAALYPYENELYAIETTGKVIREVLENAARYYLPCTGECSDAALINPKVIGYNYDMAQGVEYEIDLTKPEGHRIRNLRYRGKPLADDQALRVAVNNYRAGGSGGYTMLRGSKIVWKSGQEIRELMVRYFAAKGRLPDHADGNWRVEPEAARTALRKQALTQSRPAHVMK